MKAVQINKYGGVEVLEVIQDLPNPVPSENQILVEVYASSINPIDWKIRDGYMRDAGWLNPLKFPVTLGSDFSGVIKEIKNNVSDLKVGDEVYGYANILYGGSGSFAEFVVTNVENTAQKPKVDFTSAAALPLVGSSAIQALDDHIKLQRNQKILIHGGAGGIGHIAIQIARAIGAYVATTVSSNDVDFVKGLGADEVIDYKKQKFEGILKDFDAVFDTVGGDTTNKSFEVLKKGGILVSMVGKPDEALAERYGVSAIGQGTQTNAVHLKRLARLVDGGKVRVSIDKVYPFGKIKEAFTYQEQIHPRGKVVIKIKRGD